MATINEITNAATYTGNADLGGGSFGVIKIDPAPLQDLAKYTMLYNKAEYDQRQKDVDAKAKELADLTSLDLNAAIPKDRKDLLDEYNGIVKEASDYARNIPKTQQEKLDRDLKFKDRVRTLTDKIKGANARSIVYKATQDLISKETNTAYKEYLKKELETKANSTDVFTPLTGIDQYDIAPVETKAPPRIKIDVTNPGDNMIVQRDFDLPDMKALNSQASYLAIGLDKLAADPNSPGFEAQSAAGKMEPVESAKAISSIIAQTVGANGTGPPEQITEEILIKKNSGNRIFTGVIDQITAYNNYMDRIVTSIKSGAFQDKLGKKVQFGFGGIDERDFEKIDITKGYITPEELLKVRILSQTPDISYDTKVIETDDAIQQAQIATTRRGQDLDFKVAWKNANRPIGSGGGKSDTDAIDNPALLYGEHIDRLKSYFSNNPEIKDFVVAYSGIDAKTRMATGVQEGQSVRYNKDGSYAIIDKNGKVLKNEPVTSLAQGYIEAVKTINVDPTKDVDGSQSAAWQQKGEQGFVNVYGTKDYKGIYDGWGKTNAASPSTSGGTININDIPLNVKLEQKGGKYYYNGKEVVE